MTQEQHALRKVDEERAGIDVGRHDVAIVNLKGLADREPRTRLQRVIGSQRRGLDAVPGAEGRERISRLDVLIPDRAYNLGRH
jgi:hypothetical protein